ncbi:hypothetical protein AAG906_007992 [Vitis piasezkii]
MLVSYFYEGMSPTMKQLLETMCGGDFMSKTPDEAFEFLNYVAEISRSWDEQHERNLHKSKSQSNSNEGMCMVNKDVDLQAKMIALTKRLKELEGKGFHEVNAIYDNPIYMKQCSSCQSKEHEVSDCPTIPAMGERLVENHPNIQQLMEDSPQQVSLVEQAIDEVKATITLRGGKQVDQPMSKPKEKEEKNEDDEKSKRTKTESFEREKKDMLLAPPFSMALQSRNVVNNALNFFEVLKQVKINIPLLDMNRQVSAYAKFLKDLCTIKKGMHLKKKAFLTKQVSAIIQCKTPIKYKNPECPTISVNIDNTFVKITLLDLGPSMNLLPYSVYMQLGLGELKSTSITLSLEDRSVKFPRGIIENVLIQIDNFYYTVDFVVLDTEQGTSGLNHVPIILGQPFIAITNALINFRSGVMQLTFGNMTIELNIFHSCKKYGTKEDEELMETYLIELPMEELKKEKVEDNFSKLGEAISNEWIEVWKINEEIQPLKLMKWSFSFKKVKTMKHGRHNNPKTMKKKLKEWHNQLIQKNKFKEGFFKPHVFPRKLKYQGVGPFIVCKPYPN